MMRIFSYIIMPMYVHGGKINYVEISKDENFHQIQLSLKMWKQSVYEYFFF